MAVKRGLPAQRLRRLLRWAASMLVLLTPGLAHARWLRAESPLFVAYSNGDEGKLRSFVEDLERFDAFLRVLTGTTAPPAANKLEIILVSNGHVVREVNPYMPSTIAGFYSAGSGGVFAIAERRTENEEFLSAQAVIFHEYTHHFVNQYFPGVYPTWYQEGFAEYCSTIKFRGGNVVEFGRPLNERAASLFYMPWLPIQQVIAPARGSYQLGEMFYAESWLATHYLLRDPRREPLLIKYLTGLRNGADPTTSFQGIFGMDFPTFEKQLQAYLRGKSLTYTQGKWTPPASPHIDVSAEPPAADAMLLAHARLVAHAVRKADAPAFIAQLRTAAAPFPDDPLALRTLAMAEISFGDPDQADAPLDRLLKAHPEDVEANYLKGFKLMTAASRSPKDAPALFLQARPFFAKAHQLDANYYPALYLYAESFLAAPGPPSENTLNVYLLAHDLAPQVDDISLEAARALKRANRWPEAKVLLEMVAYEPHPNGATLLARRMLEAGASAADPLPTELDDDQP